MKKQIYPSELHARVAGINKANRAMRILAPIFYEIVERFGKEKLAVVKADGNWTARFVEATRHTVTEVFPAIEAQIERTRCDTLKMVIRVVGNYGNKDRQYTDYVTVVYYVGSLIGKTPALVAMHPFRPEDYSSEYTIEEIVSRRKQIAKLEAQISQLTGYVEPFRGTRETF